LCGRGKARKRGGSARGRVQGGKEKRLQKILAEAGIGSRRQCEKFIAEGRVSVDGRTVTLMGTKVDANRHVIAFDGVPVRPEKKVYFLLNKPRQYVCTLAEEDAGRRAIDLLPGVEQNIRSVGRLDKDSEGLIVLTNDGELINLLTHPRHRVPKTYRVKVDGRLSGEDIDVLRKGVFLAEGKARTSKVTVLHSSNRETILDVELRQGLNRQVRRMFARIDHRVRSLKRTAIAGLTDPKLKPGRYRRLTRTEVDQLYRAAVETTSTATVCAPSRRVSADKER